MPDLSETPTAQKRCHIHLHLLPPYVGGDDDDDIEGWYAECCGCGWRGAESQLYSKAVLEGFDHLNAALAVLQARAEQADRLRDALDIACDVAVWMSGSASFGPDGEARIGWIKQRERLYDALKVLRESLDEQELAASEETP